MREIKFRAWFTLKNRMVNHESLSLFYDSDEGFTFAFDDSTFVDEEHAEGTLNYELMQFTGLYDKNGKEIYEGDVLEAQDDDGSFYLKVAYDGEYARYWFVDEADSGYCYAPDEFGRDEILVVGNIYENPELLREI
jgi:uncharacterized phage protein (TIGR01671 family)